jgi:hypothetical protein
MLAKWPFMVITDGAVACLPLAWGRLSLRGRGCEGDAMTEDSGGEWRGEEEDD